jgi:hypothetical protein
MVSIERPGLTRNGDYRNMWGKDITSYTARIDYLFQEHPATVGIADGGNEIGMGSLHDKVLEHPALVPMPSVTTTTKLVLSCVCNWGAYGVVAALSRLTGRDLLPSPQEHGETIRQMVGLGAVEGVSGRRQCGVDSFTLEENLEVLGQIRAEVGLAPLYPQFSAH